ncbi:metal-dependent transcriptional regulator [Methanohalobium sp.]|uniref:metal-dependent transcriptional regulator n=1 Tax=Methanohalobium sp. TaxID=2837493 RepID=UPI0025D2BAD6|nr:metal-dependent transcriptional regulator [Methanohalobium sp.]
MGEFTGLELTPRKIQYLKFLLEKNETVRTTDISSQLSVDPSTTTKVINELTKSGYVNHIPYRGVCLTEYGREYAEFLLRRHRILSLLLSHYGLSTNDACGEVSRFEGYVSKYAVDRICKSMGHPQLSNCGEIKHDSCELVD